MAAAPARASGSAPVDPSTLLDATGVSRTPVSYVILVDVSGSMLNGDLFRSVQRSLHDIVKSLHRQDSLAIDTFGDSTSVVLAPTQVANVSDAGSLLDNVTVAPSADTDMGGALNQALSQISQQQPLPQVAAVLLLTDGKPDMPSGATYSLPGIDSASSSPDLSNAIQRSPAWQKLRQGFADLAPATTVVGCGLALRPGLDLGPVLDNVFANTVVDSHATTPTLQEFVGQAQSGAQVKAAGVLLADDSGMGVKATITAGGPASLGSVPLATGSYSAMVTFTANTSYVPLTVSNPNIVTTGGMAVTARGLPSSVTVKPGSAVSVPVTLSWNPPSAHAWLPGGHTSGSADLKVVGSVSSPWTATIAGGGFDKSFAVGPLVGNAAAVSGTMSTSMYPLEAAILALLLLAAVGGGAFVALHEYCPVGGFLEVWVGGENVSVPLGRHRLLRLGAVEVGEQRAKVRVRSARRDRGPAGKPALWITFRSTDGARRKESKRCEEGSVVILAGNWQFRHRLE